MLMGFRGHKNFFLAEVSSYKSKANERFAEEISDRHESHDNLKSRDKNWAAANSNSHVLPP